MVIFHLQKLSGDAGQKFPCHLSPYHLRFVVFCYRCLLTMQTIQVSHQHVHNLRFESLQLFNFGAHILCCSSH